MLMTRIVLLLGWIWHAGFVCGADPFDPALVDKLAADAIRSGNPARGAVLYASPTSACLSCHRVGEHGGDVGPNLSDVGAKQKLAHIVESMLWPERVVDDKYKAIAVLTADGRVLRGYADSETDETLSLRDSANGKIVAIPQDDIEDVREIGTLMPQGLLAKMSSQDQQDLIAFLADLGKHEKISADSLESLLAHSHSHHPVAVESMPREPLNPAVWPSWQAHVNRDRVYDFYSKQARHFRDVDPRPTLLTEFPGLDGGKYGHWGNQSDATWADDRWNQTDLGSMQSGVFRGKGITVSRGICVRLGEGSDGLSACFDAGAMDFVRVWKGGFVKFSEFRSGLINGLLQDGSTVQIEPKNFPYDPTLPKQYLGLYRHGRRVLFSYRVGDVEYIDTAFESDGKFHRTIARRDEHPDREWLQGGDPQWPQVITTEGRLGEGNPYAVDKIELPTENPWNALLYCSGHGFLANGTAILCTMQGDVWRVDPLHEDLKEVRWRRIASGLHQPLGVAIDGDQIYLICRDQLVRLKDRNDDGEIDFYECFSDVLQTSPSGHDYTCGLWQDAEGQFYTASGKQGVMRIAADGKTAEVIATGLRNSDGLGLLPDGRVTIPSSEGDWMPASMIASIRPDGPVLNRLTGKSPDSRGLPFFGRPGTGRSQPPEIPMLYLPRGVDNSSGGQVYIDSDRWGPLRGNQVHLSYGAGSAFLLLADESDGWIQGAAVRLTGEFASGAHRGKFNPADGQLYVSGMAGWGTYTTDDGCFERVRFTGNDQTQLPTGFHLHQNGIRIDYARPLRREVVSDVRRHFAQAWNYRYSGAYGSPEYSARQLGLRGHDVMPIASATVVNRGHSLFLEIPDLQPVNQLHLLIQADEKTSHDFFMTVNRLDEPFTGFDKYVARDKALLPHPMLADLSRPLATARNPHRKALQNARPITIKSAKNLMFDQTRIRVAAGEPIRLTFENPDAVPHNWALLNPGQLETVGKMANRMIADPEAAARHYIPKSKQVLAYTDVVEPYSSFTIYFHAPKKPGRYPYLCTFPGHWMVMNGVMIVE